MYELTRFTAMLFPGIALNMSKIISASID